MIAQLKGIVDSQSDSSFILDVQGVGYLLSASKKTLSLLPNVGKATKIYTEPLFRQDMIYLYGFTSLEEKEWFKLLLSVQGVGAKAALSILSVLNPEDIYGAIYAQDGVPFTQADGVGKKVAGRIIHELKGKLPAVDLDVSASSTPAGSTTNANQEIDDATAALVSLGYAPHLVSQTIRRLIKETPDLSAQELIKQGLQSLS